MSFVPCCGIGLVVEDAVNGIMSGKASGARTLASATTTPRHVLATAEPDWIVQDLTQYVILCDYSIAPFDIFMLVCQ